MPEKPKREGRRFVRRKRNVSPGSARRSGGSSHRHQGTSHPIVKRIKPSADSRLKRVFAQIGVPDIQPIKPDPFQVKALHTIGRCDCLVSAPTGSGKTWIAEEAIARILKKGGKAWYASPLKALTNSKYLEFMDRFGQQAVGILTGDRKENANAPILTGTTEILRNQLYDAMHEGTNFASDLVILDEAHFLGDQDRGVVWEETMIYLPVRVNLLLLSATIGNAQQIAQWLESIRSKTCVVVEEVGRPVPLHYLFFYPTGTLLPFMGPKGIDKKVRTYLNRPSPPVLSRPRSLPPFGDMVRVLKKFDLLPAIFFLKSRADCDGALERCMDGVHFKGKSRMALNNRIDELTQAHPRQAGHRHMWYLRQGGVAAHHGGQLPAWKLLVENLMTKGLLDAVFATSTVAAGVNFPARSVLFFNSDRYNGHEFVPLNATEFHQMTGRAGRRGKDHVGFAVAVPGRYMDLRLVADLCTAPPEDVVSQIKVDFSMVLNLLLSHTREDVKKTFEKSFATHLSLANQEPGTNSKLKKAGDDLMTLLPEALCGRPEQVIELIRNRAALIHELATMRRRQKGLESRLSKTALLVPGRLFLDRRNRLYCAVKHQARRDRDGVLACLIKQGSPTRAGLTGMRWFRPEKVSHFLDRVVKLPSSEDPEGMTALVKRLSQTEIPAVLESLSLGEEEVLQLKPLKGRVLLIEQELGSLVCNECSHFKKCHGKPRGAFRTVLEDFAYIWDVVNAVRTRLWNSFVKHLEFLKEEAFVNEDESLTYDGARASQLRLDQPLMIAEALRRRVLPSADPALLAALVAPFVYDRDTDVVVDESRMPRQLVRAHERLRKALTPLMERMSVRGFEVRPIALWPAATIYAWANGHPWEKVVESAGMAEGDLAMLVSRTADNLRQIGSLGRVYPDVVRSALEAISIILREPVLVD